ncbi:trimethyllysine dioxygenase, mitochondrial-like [Penaeus monodon]|uniref:trimethyllysine dioxygenase, mitochondrial-like n=1 Tax=Penaeus monodon TaxID=6687 RepID=UPI0018A72DC8|nr:trimethyllysine dioxygenase, mitochondrial-like [Penaeus monodon]
MLRSSVLKAFRCVPGRFPIVPCNQLQNRKFSTPPLGAAVAEVLDAGTRLELSHPRWPHTLALTYPWLRDHCRCPKCYNYKTFQRIHDVYKIPLNIRPASVKTNKDGVVLEWPDGHKSQYDYKFLWQNSFESKRTSFKEQRVLWTAAKFPKEPLTTVPLSELTKPDKEGLKKLISSIMKYGFGFISEVPADVESTRAAVEQICPLKTTFYGEAWAMEANMEYADTAYSKERLGAHTDTTYFSQACRIQVFHCFLAADQGGENLLVDGFSVAKQFHDRHPEGYKFLSETAIPSEYIEEGRHHLSLDTIFKHDPAKGRIKQFRYNIYDRAPLSSIPLEHMQEFYLHLRNLTSIIRNPKNEYWIKLEPGKVLLTDNWRLMHGRAAFSGKRVMGGCYLDNDDFLSKANVLGINFE